MSFEAGMNSPNLPRHVNITSALNTEVDSGKSLAFVKCKHLSAVLVYFTKIFRETSVEKYKEFKGVNFHLMRARTKVLVSFERQQIELALFPF